MTSEEFKRKYYRKEYIGDGLFVRFDGYHFILSTERENGENWVGLEPPVFNELLKYRENLYKDAENIKNDWLA